MEETLNPSPGRRPSKSAEVEAFRRYQNWNCHFVPDLLYCAELRCNPHGHPLVGLSAERQQLMEEFLLDLQNRCKLIEEEDLSVDALEPDGLDEEKSSLSFDI